MRSAHRNSRTRRYSQRVCLSRSVLTHGPRQAHAWLIFDVRQNMKLPLQLTDHARSRLRERTSLSESAFVGLLQNYQTVSVGYRRSSGHWHRLFYSQSDRTHFIAIQDIANGDIITILPLDYHENLAWRIEEAQKRRAVWKASPDIHAELFTPKPELAPGSRMETTGVFAPDGRKVNLGSHRFSVLPTSASDALSDDAFVSKLFQKIAQRGADLRLLE